MPQITQSRRTEKPLVPIEMISHGTLTSLDLQKSRRFYEEVLGLEVIQVSTVSMLARKGTDHVYVIVETGEPSTMGMFDHNGIDVATREAVDEAHAVLTGNKSQYGLGRITKAPTPSTSPTATATGGKSCMRGRADTPRFTTTRRAT